MSDTLSLIIIVSLLVISAVYSASETAITAASRARIFALAQEGNRLAQLVKRLKDQKEKLIGTILLGNTFVNSASAALITVFFLGTLGPKYGPLAAAFTTTFLLLIFTEILPKTVSLHHAERVSLALAPFLNLSMKLLSPVTWLIQTVVRATLALFSVKLDHVESHHTASDALRGTIDLHHSEGVMEKEDRDMLGSIIDLNKREVSEIMIHRKQVFSLDITMDPELLLEKAIGSSHSRIPLYKGESENIVGIIHIKDLMKMAREQRIGLTREMIRRAAQRPWFVPETTVLADQLSAFRTKRKHFACVVNEYGAWQGIVTLEDIIEEIVGEIEDEHDPFGIADIIPFGESAYKVAGTVTIRDINRQLGWNLPDAYATTMAGLVLHEARCIPDAGAVFEFFGHRFTVDEKKVNQITQLIVEKLARDNDDFDDAQE